MNLSLFISRAFAAIAKLFKLNKAKEPIGPAPKGLVVVGRISDWLKNPRKRLPVSCTVYVVDDTMDETDHSIEQSWLFTSHALRNAAGVAIHLSNLRPAGKPNGKGLVSSGPVSFAKIYSMFNEVLRRGGTYKNGACLGKNTYVQTTEGPLQVKDLVGVPFTALVNGQAHPSSPEGFWETGTKQLYKLTTKKGFTVEATEDHQFLVATRVCSKPVTYEYSWQELKDITLGSQISLSSHTVENSWGGYGSKELGWLVGHYLGNGTYTKKDEVVIRFWDNEREVLANQMRSFIISENLLGTVNQFGGELTPKITNLVGNGLPGLQVMSSKLGAVVADLGIADKKNINYERLNKTSSEFHKGVLRGFFDADGSVIERKDSSRYELKASQANRETLALMQQLLSRLGIISSIYKDEYFTDKISTFVGVDGKEHFIKQSALYILTISGENVRRFYERVGFSHPEKQTRLREYASQAKFKVERYVDEVESITPLIKEEVYDCSIPGVYEFDANGLRAHNCTLHLDDSHPDAVAFATAPRSDLPWVKRALNVGPDFLSHPDLSVFLKAAAYGDLFFVKKQYDVQGNRIYHNVCASGKTWVHTTEGPKQVKDLVEVPFTAVVDGQEYQSTSAGFWSNGLRQTHLLKTREGYSASLTPYHQFQLSSGEWKVLKDLQPGDKLKLNNHRARVQWGGYGTFELGDLLGQTIESQNVKLASVELEGISSDFQRGLLESIFDVAGKVNLEEEKSISLSLEDCENLYVIQRMLLRFGITSSVIGCTLYIVGEENFKAFTRQVEFFTYGVDSLLGSSNVATPWEATVESISVDTLEEVYDCTIPGIQKFDANGLMAHNCLEVLLRSNCTCLLAHLNLGALQVSKIASTMRDSMEWLCKLHAQTGVGETGYYLSPEEDKQVGLGMLGLANLLAIEGVSYADFVDALEYVVETVFKRNADHLNPKALYIATAIQDGYAQAAEVAKSYKMERAFVIAPTANCSFKSKDRQGNTCSPEIAPPVSPFVERESESMEVIYADYHPNTEIAYEVGFDTHFRLNDAWQQMMDQTGLGHSISMNWWSDVVKMDEELITRWFNSSLKALYYAWRVLPDTQDKSQVMTPDSYNMSSTSSPLESEKIEGFCPLNPSDGECSQCAE